MIIYVVDKSGRKNKQFAPFLDGLLSGPDAIFGLMKYYLVQLNITAADKILFVADGAQWIWERAESLFDQLAIAKEKQYFMLDYYHAVQHLSEFAKHKKLWKKAEKESWVKKMKKLLLLKDIDSILDSLKAASKGSRKGKLRTEYNYFIKHKNRMNYPVMKDLALPLGSGAIESSIRRVVNLRLKGSGIYWNIDTASEMLMLRSFYKTGRWNDVKKLAFSYAG